VGRRKRAEEKTGTLAFHLLCTFSIFLIYGWRQEERKETEKLPSLCWNVWIMKKRDSPPLTPHQWVALSFAKTRICFKLCKGRI